MEKRQLFGAFWDIAKSTNGGHEEMRRYEHLLTQAVESGASESQLSLTLKMRDKAWFVSHWTKAKPPLYFPRERASKSDAQIQDFNQYHGKA